MRPMIRRRLEAFGLDLLWEGEKEIKVLDGNRVIETISTGSRGLVSATDTMKKIEVDYHRAAQAMAR
jgi:hypothetical protein